MVMDAGNVGGDAPAPECSASKGSEDPAKDHRHFWWAGENGEGSST